jgi:hypothetical protein
MVDYVLALVKRVSNDWWANPFVAVLISLAISSVTDNSQFSTGLLRSSKSTFRHGLQLN